MFELITQALEEKKVDFLVKFPRFLMDDTEVQVVEFILAYVTKHGEPPSVTRVSREFDTFTSITPEVKTPITDTYDLELEAKRANHAANVLSKCLAEIREGKKVPLEELSGMVQQLTRSGTELVDYETFDRDLYFRTGVPLKTGLRLIDRATGGVYPGEFMAIIARLGIGKSTFAQLLMKRWYLEGHRRILAISKEMPPADVFARMDAMVGKFNSRIIRDTEFEIEARAKVATVKTKIAGSTSQVIMPTMSSYTIPEIHSMARNVGADAIVIDGLYLMSSGNRRLQNWEEMKDVTRAVKEMSLTLRVPVIGTTQIKRNAKGGDIYDTEDIAYSDSIGQDADFILAIKRKPSIKEGIQRMEMQLIKNRYGPEIVTLVELLYETMTMREISVEGESS